MITRCYLLVGLLSIAPSAMVSAYDERPVNEDDYFAARMQDRHHQGQALYQEPQGRGRYPLILGALAGMGMEWFWTSRSLKKTKAEFEARKLAFGEQWTRERDMLINRRSYPIKVLANDVEEADAQLLQLLAAAEDAGIEMGGGGGTHGRGGGGAVRGGGRSNEMDYEEFRQPDVNGDNVISRQEFNTYILQYLEMYPDTIERDIPRFEDFDVNRDGMVTFAEWQMYLDGRRQADLYNSQDNELIRGMQDTAAQSQGFDSLGYNINRAQDRAGRY